MKAYLSRVCAPTILTLTLAALALPIQSSAKGSEFYVGVVPVLQNDTTLSYNRTKDSDYRQNDIALSGYGFGAYAGYDYGWTRWHLALEAGAQHNSNVDYNYRESVFNSRSDYRSSGGYYANLLAGYQATTDNRIYAGFGGVVNRYEHTISNTASLQQSEPNISGTYTPGWQWVVQQQASFQGTPWAVRVGLASQRMNELETRSSNNSEVRNTPSATIMSLGVQYNIGQPNKSDALPSRTLALNGVSFSLAGLLSDTGFQQNRLTKISSSTTEDAESFPRLRGSYGRAGLEAGGLILESPIYMGLRGQYDQGQASMSDNNSVANRSLRYVRKHSWNGQMIVGYQPNSASMIYGGFGYARSEFKKDGGTDATVIPGYDKYLNGQMFSLGLRQLLMRGRAGQLAMFIEYDQVHYYDTVHKTTTTGVIVTTNRTFDQDNFNTHEGVVGLSYMFA